MFNRYIHGAVILTVSLCLITFGGATYSFKVVVKYPFSSGHFDTLGNWVSDSLVRRREIKVTIYRTGMIENLSQEQITDNKGETIFTFSNWHDGTVVDIANLQQMDIEFPNTDKVIRVGGAITFEPLKFEFVEFKVRAEIPIILPMTVYTKMDTVGAGPCTYAFAIITDLHIAEGKKKQRHIIGSDTLWLQDFGSPGFNDSDNDPNETTSAIENNENIVTKINQLMGPGYNYPIKYVVCLGDITSTSERSEYQRAKKVLVAMGSNLNIITNHGTRVAGINYGVVKGDIFEIG